MFEIKDNLIDVKEDFTKSADIKENDLLQKYPKALEILLRDHTTKKNIFWATSDYEYLGIGYEYNSPITTELITGNNGTVIMPRVKKEKLLQQNRVRGMAEVFTPSWICNKQNNLIDNAWFGQENVFNAEIDNSDGSHTWKVNDEKITFLDGKSWKDYIMDTRLEVTCGEAPYVTSRYDTTTGDFIPVNKRIGLLDRKLRVVSENVDKSGEWLKFAQKAYMNIYAFEWQGDNLILARESMLYTFIENYIVKFGKLPLTKSINYIAYIISWNVWQMDGLKGVVPNSCKSTEKEIEDMFGGKKTEIKHCKGCEKDDMKEHNGIYCQIKDWSNKRKKIRFIDLIKK